MEEILSLAGFGNLWPALLTFGVESWLDLDRIQASDLENCDRELVSAFLDWRDKLADTVANQEVPSSPFHQQPHDFQLAVPVAKTQAAHALVMPMALATNTQAMTWEAKLQQDLAEFLAVSGADDRAGVALRSCEVFAMRLVLDQGPLRDTGKHPDGWNPSKVLMSRVKMAKERVAKTREEMSEMVEAFLSDNNIDERGRSLMRSQDPSVQAAAIARSWVIDQENKSGALTQRIRKAKEPGMSDSYREWYRGVSQILPGPIASAAHASRLGKASGFQQPGGLPIIPSAGLPMLPPVGVPTMTHVGLPRLANVPTAPVMHVPKAAMQITSAMPAPMGDLAVTTAMSTETTQPAPIVDLAATMATIANHAGFDAFNTQQMAQYGAQTGSEASNRSAPY